MTSGTRIPFVLCAAVLTGCVSSRGPFPEGAQEIGPHQYIVTAPPSQLFDKAKETCAKLGRKATEMSFQIGTTVEHPRYEQIKFECLSAYEIVPVGEDSYKIWVPTDEMPRTPWTIPATSDTPAHVIQGPDFGPVAARVRQQATDYCAKLNQTMVVTGGGFDMGTGFFSVFKCVPPQGAATH